jgi:hypothetical protein
MQLPPPILRAVVDIPVLLIVAKSVFAVDELAPEKT